MDRYSAIFHKFIYFPSCNGICYQAVLNQLDWLKLNQKKLIKVYFINDSRILRRLDYKGPQWECILFLVDY